MKQRGKILFLLLAFVFILILFSNFSLAGTLKVTEEHPFLINGSWISASDLKVGDILKTADGKSVRITNLQDVETEEPFPVYNLEAGIYHNFVVGEDKLVVHNSNLPMLYSRPSSYHVSDPINIEHLTASIGQPPKGVYIQETPLIFIEKQKYIGFRNYLKKRLSSSLIKGIDSNTDDLLLLVKRGALEYDESVLNPSSYRTIAKGLSFRDRGFYASQYGGSVDDYIKLATPDTLRKSYFFGSEQEIHYVLNKNTGIIYDPKIKILGLKRMPYLHPGEYYFVPY